MTWSWLGASELIRRWIAITLAVSIVAVLDGGALASWFALEPSRVFRGELWRLVTWPLVHLHPIALVLACAAIYKFGGELAFRWGDRRLRRFVVHIVIVAAVGTCLLAAVTDSTHLVRHGGWAVMDALVIAWARQFPNARLVFYGFLVLHGRRLIVVTVGIAILFAIYVSPVVFAPELIACLAAATYPPAWLRR